MHCFKFSGALVVRWYSPVPRFMIFYLAERMWKSESKGVARALGIGEGVFWPIYRKKKSMGVNSKSEDQRISKNLPSIAKWTSHEPNGVANNNYKSVDRIGSCRPTHPPPPPSSLVPPSESLHLPPISSSSHEIFNSQPAYNRIKPAIWEWKPRCWHKRQGEIIMILLSTFGVRREEKGRECWISARLYTRSICNADKMCLSRFYRLRLMIFILKLFLQPN